VEKQVTKKYRSPSSEQSDISRSARETTNESEDILGADVSGGSINSFAKDESEAPGSEIDEDDTADEEDEDGLEVDEEDVGITESDSDFSASSDEASDSSSSEGSSPVRKANNSRKSTSGPTRKGGRSLVKKATPSLIPRVVREKISEITPLHERLGQDADDRGKEDEEEEEDDIIPVKSAKKKRSVVMA
jgi:hypothetical protein